MAVKKFEDNSLNGFNSESSTDLSSLGNGINPFGESMAAGNTVAAKGPMQAQGSNSEAEQNLGNYGKTYNANDADKGSETFTPKNRVK